MNTSDADADDVAAPSTATRRSTTPPDTPAAAEEADSAPSANETSDDVAAQLSAPPPPHVPSVEELDAALTADEELADANLVSRVVDLCLSRGTFVFPKPSVMIFALGLDEEVSPHRAGRWALRRIILPVGTLHTPPGPEASPVDGADSILGSATTIAWSTITSTAEATGRLAWSASSWASYLLQPAVAAAHTTAGLITSSLTAPLTAITDRPADGSQPTAAAATPGATPASSLARLAASGSGRGEQAPEDEGIPSSTSFDLTDRNRHTDAIDAACSSVFGDNVDSNGIVFRPALLRVTAKVVMSLIDRIKAHGALSRVMPWAEWEALLFEQHNVSHVSEVTAFLVNHVQALRPLTCDSGKGVFIAVQLTESAEAALWPEDAATELLDLKLRSERLIGAVESWESDLHALEQWVSDSENPDAETQKRLADTRWLLEHNKLFEIELRKSLLRASSPEAFDPVVELKRIHERLGHLGDVRDFPIEVIPSPDEDKKE